jgi:hypothetical protein
LVLVAVIAVGIYGLLRLLLVGGAVEPYCNEMGFFGSIRRVCYASLGPAERLLQQIYNVVATFLGIFLVGVFGIFGNVSITPRLLVGALLWFSLAVLGWAVMPRRTVALLALVLVTAALSVMLYRARNQTIGIMGVYATAGVGLAYLLERAREGGLRRAVSVGVVLLAVGVTLTHALELPRWLALLGS